jgi:ribosomal-protein-alanine N-acetyltransferase
MILIDSIRASDLARIASINRIVLPGTHSSQTLLRLYRQRTALFFAARMANRLVGYVVVSVSNDCPVILSLAVETRSQCRGVGKSLMSHCIEMLEKLGAKQVELVVRATAQAAVLFYKNLGFWPVRALPFYYRGADGILMRKLL